MGQHFMNKSTSSVQSTELSLRAVQNTRANFSHGKHPNQIEHRITETPNILSPSLLFISSVGLKEMSMA